MSNATRGGHALNSIDVVEHALRDSGSKQGQRMADGTMWQCPAHDDRTPSLGVKHDGSKVLLNCYAGCDFENIVGALDLSPRDLFDEPHKPSEGVAARSGGRPRLVEEYPYPDRNGEHKSTKLRFEPKDFRWTNGNPGVLYNLPEVVEAEHVHVNEGEKAADKLNEMLPLGEVATCTPVPGCWEKEFTEYVVGKRLTLWVDRDAAGLSHAAKVYRQLTSAGISVDLVQSNTSAEKSDAFDHIEAGFDVSEAVPLDPDKLVDADAKSDERAKHTAQLYFGREVYESLTSAPEAQWLARDFLRVGKTTILGGDSRTGKSWLALQALSGIAAGFAAWPGADVPASRGGVVVYLGFDPHMTVEDVAKRLQHLDNGPHRRGQDFPAWAWADNFVTVGHSELNGPFPVDRYRLDSGGVDAIASDILRPIHEERGAISAIVVDTISTAYPEGTNENDSSAMNAIITRLSMLAIEFHASVLGLHHPTKANASAGERFNDWEPLSYFRGSGALTNAAAVLAGLWSPFDAPTKRALTCWSNAAGRSRQWFEVCEPPDADRLRINYWLPADAPDGTRGEDDGANLEALAAAFTDRHELLSWKAFVTGSQGSYSGAARKGAEKLLAWATVLGFAGREEDNPRRVYLTAEGKVNVAAFQDPE